MAIVIVTAAVSGLLAGRHVVATPLGMTVRAGRRRPRPYVRWLVLLAGTPEAALHRVLMRQALIAATPVCALAALAGLLPLGAAAAAVVKPDIWYLWPVPHALVMAGLGVLAAALAASCSRRRLRRALAPVLLRTE
jgi:hypothetical protein